MLTGSSRLRRIRNYQNTEFFPALVLRPASIAVTLVIGDWRWITPNRVTLLATLCKLAAAALFTVDDRAWLALGVITLLLGAVLDHVDGTLARYRRTTSHLGFFLDTIGDAVTWFTTLAALGWLAWSRTGDVTWPLVAGAGAYALMVNGYTRAVVEAATARRAAAPTAPASETSEPPARSPSEWLRWAARATGQIWKFQEMDLFFWVGVLVLADRIRELLVLVAVTQCIALAAQIVRRGRVMGSLDRRATTPDVG